MHKGADYHSVTRPIVAIRPADKTLKDAKGIFEKDLRAIISNHVDVKLIGREFCKNRGEAVKLFGGAARHVIRLAVWSDRLDPPLESMRLCARQRRFSGEMDRMDVVIKGGEGWSRLT